MQFNYLWAPIIDRINKFSQIIGFTLITSGLVLAAYDYFSGVEFYGNYYPIVRGLVLSLFGIFFTKKNLFSGLNKISDRLGHRRAWIVSMQFIILISLVSMELY